MSAPTGEWRSISAGILFGVAITGWILIWLKMYGEEQLSPDGVLFQLRPTKTFWFWIHGLAEKGH